jgi:hypothetical protein
MPEWVIVGEANDGVPIVLADWIMGALWVTADAARRREVPFVIFRDRWRAKRQSKRIQRSLTPRAVRLDRL